MEDVEAEPSLWYTVWGMWGALSNKEGVMEVKRVGNIERKPVGRPRKNVDDGQEQCDEESDMDADAA